MSSRTLMRVPRRPASSLAERWTTIDGIPLFYRESPHPPPGSGVMMHLHGFGLSGRYLLPTAARLRNDFHTLVPDLPGFGHSADPPSPLGIIGLAQAAVRFLDDRGVERATLVGNSMGCPVILELAHRFPERVDRAILVSPAGGLYNRPLARAIGQIAVDGSREPLGLIRVAAPDYLRFGIPSTFRLFRALTHYPSLQRLLELDIVSLVVLGERDPLLPGAARVRQVAAQTDRHLVVVELTSAAHAINFSHAEELAHIIRQFMADEPIADHPHDSGRAHVREIHRGTPPRSASRAG